jgi:hypothetical protein
MSDDVVVTISFLCISLWCNDRSHHFLQMNESMCNECDVALSHSCTRMSITIERILINCKRLNRMSDRLTATTSAAVVVGDMSGKKSDFDISSSFRNNSIGKLLGSLPNVILTYIWHFFNINGPITIISLD